MYLKNILNITDFFNKKVRKIRFIKKILYFLLIWLLFFNLIITQINCTPNYGEPIDQITSILWKYNSHNLKNIIQVPVWEEKPTYYYYFAVVGNQNNITNNLTVLLSDGSVYWNNFSIHSNIVALKVMDINSDIEPEIIIGTSNNLLYVFNVTSFAIPEWTLSISDIIAVDAINFTKDSGAEIIVFTTNSIITISNNGTLLWNYSVPFNISINKLFYDFGDLNSDHYMDIIFGSENNLIALDGKSQTPIWNKTLSSVLNSLHCIKNDQNRVDIIIGTIGNLCRLYGPNGSITWNFTGIMNNDFSGKISNILIISSNSEISEIYCTAINKSITEWTSLYKFRMDGSFIKSTRIEKGNSTIVGLVVGDINGDNYDELVSADNKGRVIAFNQNLDVIWNYTYTSPIQQIVIGYINFDSIYDILVAADDGYILCIGIPLGEFNFYMEEQFSQSQFLSVFI
ncbi:MAG: hypothetical protein ACTSRP_22765 [Candidatus Helarchaeota archaeon]